MFMFKMDLFSHQPQIVATIEPIGLLQYKEVHILITWIFCNGLFPKNNQIAYLLYQNSKEDQKSYRAENYLLEPKTWSLLLFDFVSTNFLAKLSMWQWPFDLSRLHFLWKQKDNISFTKLLKLVGSDSARVIILTSLPFDLVIFELTVF